MEQNYFQNSGQYFRSEQSIAQTMSAVMKQVYMKMFLALLVTGFVSMWAAGSEMFLTTLFSNSWGIWVLMGVEVLLVIAISGAINKISSAMATALFFLFAIVNGLSLAPIFLLYTGESIASTFFITAATFGAMSIYGYFTNSDLSKFGSIMVMALIGLIICSVVNIFMKSETMYWIISGAGVLIFVGLTAWDTQKIKQMALTMPNATDGRLATIGALSLYLDFINLFLYLLRFLGDRK
ncbi:MAG: Bax inhibitor-1/YccA family protein [Muribaculaceae bacterium]|nr:Bax inhibitor-1/YccA family protein [Muribaculaceae bacterium]